MKFMTYSLFLALFSLKISVSLCHQEFFCPDYTAMFVVVMDQTIGSERLINDRELTFFKEDMGLRDNEIQRVFEDAVKFYNETYGLDFSNSQPNDQNEYFFENAKMTLFRFHENVHYRLIFNNWIRTGNTRTTCRDVQIGGYLVTFTGDQLLHGTYGGAEGIPAGEGDFLEYGYNIFDVCGQSPVVIQIQNATPFRKEPVDGAVFLNFDIYSHVLGYGKALGFISTKPLPDNPGEYRLVARVVFTFPDL